MQNVVRQMIKKVTNRLQQKQAIVLELSGDKLRPQSYRKLLSSIKKSIYWKVNSKPEYALVETVESQVR